MIVSFIVGAVCGAAAMLAIVTTRRPEWEADAYAKGKRTVRMACGAVLVELMAELWRLQKCHMPTPHPHHAPMRAAWRQGFRRALVEAHALAVEAREAVVATAENGRPLHPSEHVRPFVDNPATKEA